MKRLFGIFLLAFVHLVQPTFALSPNLPPLPTDTQTRSEKPQKRDISESSTQYHTSDFGAKQNHPTSYDASPSFLGPIKLQAKEANSQRSYETGRERIQHYYQRQDLALATSTTTTKQSAPTKQKLKAIVDHLARRNAPVDVKEVCESVEFVLRTRKRLLGAAKQQQASTIQLYDLCCGHGLTGMLFGCCATNKDNFRVVLVDQTKPPSHKILLELLAEVCPWLVENEDAVIFKEAPLDSLSVDTTSAAEDDNNAAKVVISTHACGSLTDQVLDLGTNLPAAAVAVMPCCYTGTSKGTPYGVQRALGVAWAADIQRSFRLQERGYHCDFATIPKEITPMNRILLGEFRGKAKAVQ